MRYTFDIYGGALRKLQEDDYYAFGIRRHITFNGVSNNYLYNGKELQDELGQYDYGARFYDPVVGRFITVDRFAEKYKRLSMYQYAANNPISNIDVNGDSTWTTNRQVKNGNNIINYNTIHITGKVLKTSGSYGSSGDFAASLNKKLNSQREEKSDKNGLGGTTTTIYNIDANYSGAGSMNDVKQSDHLVVLVDDVLGGADPKLGGGEASGLANTPGKVAYVQSNDDPLNSAFHEVGHNLGLEHPEFNSSSNPMSYTGRGAKFSALQMEIMYNNALVGKPNNGYNSARITNVNNGYNNVSTNERPYSGNRIKGMRIPLPIKNEN